MTEALTVEELGRTITFTFDDMMRYHGVHSPAGVAISFKVMQRAFAMLSPDAPPDRRSIKVRTAFRGPGARDGFEAVTRAVTDGRYTVERSLVLSDLGRLREDFVFVVTIGERVGQAAATRRLRHRRVHRPGADREPQRHAGPTTRRAESTTGAKGDGRACRRRLRCGVSIASATRLRGPTDSYAIVLR